MHYVVSLKNKNNRKLRGSSIFILQLEKLKIKIINKIKFFRDNVLCTKKYTKDNFLIKVLYKQKINLCNISYVPNIFLKNTKHKVANIACYTKFLKHLDVTVLCSLKHHACIYNPWIINQFIITTSHMRFNIWFIQYTWYLILFWLFI